MMSSGVDRLAAAPKKEPILVGPSQKTIDFTGQLDHIQWVGASL